jgi:hypothetical protein
MADTRTIKWKKPAAGQSALDATHVAFLAEQSGIAASDIERLSVTLTVALDARRFLIPDDENPAQRDKGVSEVKRAIAEIQGALEKLLTAQERLELVRFKSPFMHVGVRSSFNRDPLPHPAREHLSNLDAAVTNLAAIVGFLKPMNREGLVRYKGVADRRQTRDQRRRLVFWAIFDFWRSMGRKLSYTTDPTVTASTRKGALVDFVNAVVGCISDPPAHFSGDVVKTEIEAFNAREERR